MQIVHLEDIDSLPVDTSIALGFFDGFHKGHLKLIRTAIEAAEADNLAGAVFTFRKHPIEALNAGLCFPYLLTMREKYEIAEGLNLDYFIDSDFDEKFSRLTPDEFFNLILMRKLRAKIIVVGEDYRFGHKGKGGADLLSKMADAKNIEVRVLGDVTQDGARIGSSVIREAIMSGDMRTANELLGRLYFIEGDVKQGKKRGRKMGLPTANIDLPEKKVMPRPGVYCVLVSFDGKTYKGVGHLGDRPTFNEHRYNMEIHLFDFTGDLYGKKIKAHFVRHIRDTERFENIESMVEKIEEDIRFCRETLNEERIIKSEIIKK